MMAVKLPAGFHDTIFDYGIGHARHLVVEPQNCRLIRCECRVKDGTPTHVHSVYSRPRWMAHPVGRSSTDGSSRSPEAAEWMNRELNGRADLWSVGRTRIGGDSLSFMAS
jgi:hypothetical protein